VGSKKDKYTVETLLEVKTIRFPRDKRKEAAAWLRYWVETPREAGKTPARSLFDAAEKVPTTVDFNAPLKRVDAAAEEVVKALHNLRTNSAHLDFWLEDVFGRVEEGKIERDFLPAVEAAMDKIGKAARSAQRDDKYRPREAGKYRIVKIAGNCFLKFGLKPANGGRFEEFAEGLFEIVTGLDVVKGQGLSRQIDTYVKSLKTGKKKPSETHRI
jgi:hypothetical protein